MASWSELKSYLLLNEDAEEKSPRLVAVTLEFPDGSKRLTFVSSAEDMEGGQWISIDSIVGRVNSVDLLRAVRMAGDKVCGGLATMPIGNEEFLVLRHAMPISKLDSQRMNDFLDPLYAITGGASGLEGELSTFNTL